MKSPLQGFHFPNFSIDGEVWVGVREGGRKACLSTRAERERVRGEAEWWQSVEGGCL